MSALLPQAWKTQWILFIHVLGAPLILIGKLFIFSWKDKTTHTQFKQCTTEYYFKNVKDKNMYHKCDHSRARPPTYIDNPGRCLQQELKRNSKTKHKEGSTGRGVTFPRGPPELIPPGALLPSDAWGLPCQVGSRHHRGNGAGTAPENRPSSAPCRRPWLLVKEMVALLCHHRGEAWAEAIAAPRWDGAPRGVAPCCVTTLSLRTVMSLPRHAALHRDRRGTSGLHQPSSSSSHRRWGMVQAKAASRGRKNCTAGSLHRNEGLSHLVLGPPLTPD